MNPIHSAPPEIYTSKCFFGFPSTSHSISRLPVSFTCSPSCYILPWLRGWQSYIRHVIKREMGGSSVGWRGMAVVRAVERRYQPSLPLQWPAVTLARGPLGTRDSSSLQWAVSDFTAHEPPYTPTPDIQLGECGEVGRQQLQKYHPPPLRVLQPNCVTTLCWAISVVNPATQGS